MPCPLRPDPWCNIALIEIAAQGTEDMSNSTDIDPSTRTEIEAAVYRKMIEHLRKYPEVQNIDLMNLAYFCRNCFSKWYRSAAAERGVEMDYDQAREIVYGMSYDDYKAAYSTEATAEQLAAYEESKLKATE